MFFFSKILQCAKNYQRHFSIISLSLAYVKRNTRVSFYVFNFWFLRLNTEYQVEPDDAEAGMMAQKEACLPKDVHI